MQKSENEKWSFFQKRVPQHKAGRWVICDGMDLKMNCPFWFPCNDHNGLFYSRTKGRCESEKKQSMWDLISKTGKMLLKTEHSGGAEVKSCERHSLTTFLLCPLERHAQVTHREFLYCGNRIFPQGNRKQEGKIFLQV